MSPYQLLRPYLAERKWYLLAGMFSLLMVDLFQLMIPRIIKWAVDGISGLGGTGAHLWRYGVYIALCALAIGVFRFCWRYLIMGTARRIEEGIRGQLFDHVQVLPARFFDTTTSGNIMAHATNDMTNIRMALGMGIVGLIDTVVLGCAAIFFMGYISVPLTVLALLPMPLIAVFTKVLSRRLFGAYQEVQASFSELMEATRERFAGIRIIKAFNREAVETRQITRASRSYIDCNMKLVKLRGLIFPMVIFLTNVSLAIILASGGRRVIQGDITTGDFVAFISYLNLLTWPVMAVGWVTNMIQRGKASMDRIIRILEETPEQVRPGPVIRPEAIKGDIQLQDLWFNRETPVLKGVTLHIPAGTLQGIAGPPGSGKTTLAALIPRLYDPDKGRVSLDGHDISHLAMTRLRDAVSFMPQEPFLFSGTIRYNLAFGAPQADEDTLKSVLDKAGLTQTLEEMPHGLDTIIGEKGVMLSGGQKQRIALARALLKDAPVLVLDDPVSQVDMSTAADIIRVIEGFSGRKTVIVISHRFSIFKNAHQVAVIEQGRLTDLGTHGELLERGGYYAGAWAMQASEAALAGEAAP